MRKANYLWKLPVLYRIQYSSVINHRIHPYQPITYSTVFNYSLAITLSFQKHIYMSHSTTFNNYLTTVTLNKMSILSLDIQVSLKLSLLSYGGLTSTYTCPFPGVAILMLDLFWRCRHIVLNWNRFALHYGRHTIAIDLRAS